MRYRTLGSADLEVSEISLGSWLTFSGGVEFEQTRACTDAAFEAGINFFDTANVYGRGAAESAWGEILSGRPRDSYILATKVWGQMSDDPADQGLSAAQIDKQIDSSLARLQTDYVDLYQAQYSMLWPAPEVEAFPLCAENGIPQIVWSPLAQGLLTGKYRAGQAPPPDSRAAHSEMGTAMNLVMNDATLQAVDRLRPIAEEAGLSMAEMALAWVLRRPEVASAIVGASRPEQVHANAKASGVELTPGTLAAIDEALGDAPVKEPTLAPAAQSGVTHRSASARG